MNSSVVFWFISFFMMVMYFVWNIVLLMDNVLLMIRMFGLMWIVMENVSCIYILDEYVFSGWLMKFLIFENLMIVGYFFLIFFWFILRIWLYSIMFFWLVNFGLNLELSFNNVVILLFVVMCLVFGVNVFEIIWRSVDFFDLLWFMILMVLFGMILKEILCNV